MGNEALSRYRASARTPRAGRCAAGAISQSPRAARAGAARSASMNGGSAVTGTTFATRSSSGTWYARCAAGSDTIGAMTSRPILDTRHASHRQFLREAGTSITLWRSRMAGPMTRRTCGFSARCATRNGLPGSGATKRSPSAASYSYSQTNPQGNAK